MLDIRDLHQVSSEHPVAVRHRGGHTSYYNSKVLALGGRHQKHTHSALGTFVRDANGELNGRVTDRARAVFNNVGMRPSYTADQMRLRNRDALTFISKLFVVASRARAMKAATCSPCSRCGRAENLLHRVSYEARVRWWRPTSTSSQ